MRATKIEVRAKALGPGRHVEGVWQPAGRLIATLWLEQPHEELARAVAASITRVGDEEVVAEVMGRQDTPND